MKRLPRYLKKAKPTWCGKPRTGMTRFRPDFPYCYGSVRIAQLTWNWMRATNREWTRRRPPRTLNPVARVLRRKKIAWYFGNMMAVAAEARRLAWATAWATVQGKAEAA